MMKRVYGLLAQLFPQRITPHPNPRRIVIILPCCMGDIVIGTAVLNALHRAYPHASITWAVGPASRALIEAHPLVDAVLESPNILSFRHPLTFMRFVQQLRAGRFDLAVSLVRSPITSLAVWLSGIPDRAGLDSQGRGFGYNLRAPIDPLERHAEGSVYLKTAERLGVKTAGCYASYPPSPADIGKVEQLLDEHGLTRYLVINPAGGRNPGMTLDLKRWPPERFAALANTLVQQTGASVILVGGPNDGDILKAVEERLAQPALKLTGSLSFGEIAALARGSLGYIGNDTGLTHLAAAAGARTVMILGPSDPERYAPFVEHALALWRPSAVTSGGVSAGVPEGWSWEKDGLTVDEALTAILPYLKAAL